MVSKIPSPETNQHAKETELRHQAMIKESSGFGLQILKADGLEQKKIYSLVRDQYPPDQFPKLTDERIKRAVDRQLALDVNQSSLPPGLGTIESGAALAAARRAVPAVLPRYDPLFSLPPEQFIERVSQDIRSFIE